jgi:hypothetical protein
MFIAPDCALLPALDEFGSAVVPIPGLAVLLPLMLEPTAVVGVPVEVD